MKSYRMPFPDPLLPIVLIALLGIGTLMGIFRLLSTSSSKSREIHTRFALAQIVERLDEVEDTAFPEVTTELVAILRAAKIDWNSCGLEGNQIVDGWRRPIMTTFDAPAGTWSFCSSGRDAQMGTEDDIVSKTTRNRIGEQAAPSDGDKPSN